MLAELGILIVASDRVSVFDVVLANGIPGKGKMLTQVVTILLLILGERFLGHFAVLGKIALAVTVVLALVSGLEYFLRFYKKIARELPTGSGA